VRWPVMSVTYCADFNASTTVIARHHPAIWYEFLSA
jgi:hypothetical protein